MAQENLFRTQTNGWIAAKDEKDNAYTFCEGYKNFLNNAKTEREYALLAEKTAKDLGFKPLSEAKALKPGDKVYKVNRGKAIMLAVIGKEDIENGVNILGAHIDSPRLDLKQNPLYEDGEMALFKTHYYGGIKKYHWTAMPLAIHGKVILGDGSEVDISIGDEGSDVTFTISDLLPHLATEQYEKKLKDAIEGESLNALIGTIPVDDKDAKSPVKYAIMQYLNKTYGITEEDFISAEIELIPAYNVKDVGFDRSVVGGPSQDDRVCAYTAMKAIFDIDVPSKTAVCLLVDKEEIGSMGNTGMKSRFFENTLAEICAMLKPNYNDLTIRRCLSASQCLSADVCAAHDPNYPNVLEKNNGAKMGYGVVIVKYTGSRGKGGSSDASAEFVGEVRRLFNSQNVLWQTSELGKIDLGGGGTIAQYVANLDVDTVDCGVALLSMHSPFELASKMDIYMTYKGYKAFIDR